MKATGWLLDVHISDDNAVLWFKLQNSRSLRLTDWYKPDFYVEPKENTQLEELANILFDHPNIFNVVREPKFTSVNMKEKISVLHIRVDSTKNFRKVLFDVEKLGLIKAYYNIDILHVQRYLFQRGCAPTSKVEVEYDEKNRLVNLQVLDDDLEIEPPPFAWLIFEVEIKSSVLSPEVERDPISKVVITGEPDQKKTFEGDEAEILSGFAGYVRKENPDFLVAPQITAQLRYILERAKILKLNIQLGREEANIFKLRRLLPYAHKGRVHLDLHTFLEVGIAGLAERSRFTLAPPGLSAKWPAGKKIDSRQCFEALKRDVLLPKTGGNFRYVTTAKEAIFRDKGGLILSPKTGIHENVAELDYESMFPHIIIKHNVSYETVTPYFIDRTKKGFLGELTQKFLERRLYFKHLRKRYAKNSQEWLWCEQRQHALKAILVCIYGYSGCFANRFNNVTAYEEINRIARNILVKTINIAMQEGFEVIYADSDSIFVKKRDANRQNYENLAKTIQKETGLPIALDCHYKFLVLLRQEADPNLGATRRYFGKLMTGDLHYRGIELRRHDCPVFLKQFQNKLLEILFNAESAAIIEKEQFKKAYDYVVETCDKILEGNIKLERLIISKVLRKPVTEYTSMFPHVIAAIQMIHKGKKMKTGENIDFLYVNAAHRNPFRRVIPASVLNNGHHYYDREKYLEMVLDVAETVLGVFGFNRKHLGFKPHSKDFLKEIYWEREQETLSELQSLYQDRISDNKAADIRRKKE